jgi:hypothetical protein
VQWMLTKSRFLHWIAPFIYIIYFVESRQFPRQPQGIVAT